MKTPAHREIAPAIHYWGTPVVLVGTLNPDGAVNVAPMSSAWWLGWSCMLGLDASSQTVQNLKRERECVLNLASAGDAGIVNALALVTGSPSVPLHKKMLGYRYEADKPAHAGLDLLPSLAVKVPRVAQCAVHLEAVVESIRPFAGADRRMAIPACAVEVRIVKVHVDEALLAGPDRIDADRWEPLLMSFRGLFARGARVGPSRLESGKESAYAPWKRGPVTRLAAKAMGAVAQYRYGIQHEEDEIDAAVGQS
jgi:flavin reductase (DIM6/NTAB) family NADH-FMN oxidoreductase RutF